jgi:large subunit ribosomal protein L23
VKTDITNVLLRPIISEKSYSETEINKYRFAIAVDANKIMVRRAVEAMFGVKVKDVNVQTVQSKKKRFGRFTAQRRPWKKATVTLVDGHSLDFFEKFGGNA